MGSMILVRFPAAAREFSVLHNTHTDYEAHPDSYSVSIWWRGVSLSQGVKQPWHEQLRWSRSSVLPLSTQVRGFKPGRSRQDFSGRKNPQHASLWRGSKAAKACKRSLSGVKVVISAKLPEHSRPHSSTFRC